MKMGRFEKFFINRPTHEDHVISRARDLLALADVKEKQKCLEVGCGNGALSRHLASKYRLDVTGVDVDPEQIRLARVNTDDMPNVRFSQADATNLAFPDNDFDIVLSFGVMHHISNWVDALKEVGRVLKPAGYFIYSDLVYPDWTARIWSTKLGSSIARNYGFPTARGLSSFVEQNNLSTLYSALSMRYMLVFNLYEAVYQKQS